jgi:hypothetical protein
MIRCELLWPISRECRVSFLLRRVRRLILERKQKAMCHYESFETKAFCRIAEKGKEFMSLRKKYLLSPSVRVSSK